MLGKGREDREGCVCLFLAALLQPRNVQRMPLVKGVPSFLMQDVFYFLHNM